MLRGGAVDIKSNKEIELMRDVCQLAAQTLSCVGEVIRPSVTTQEIDDFVHRDTIARGCRPAPLNYRGFLKSCCTSINEVRKLAHLGPRECSSRVA